MAYDKQTWECGDIVTAEKLNHIEDGIANAGGGGGFFTIHLTTALVNDELTITSIDKTIDEVLDAYDNGLMPIVEAMIDEPILLGVPTILHLTRIGEANNIKVAVFVYESPLIQISPPTIIGTVAVGFTMSEQGGVADNSIAFGTTTT